MKVMTYSIRDLVAVAPYSLNLKTSKVKENI